MIDTLVPGEPQQVRGAAEWLRHTLAPALDAAHRRTLAALARADGSWSGETAEAYRARVRELATHLDRHRPVVVEAAGLLAAYADRLAACQGAMADLRARGVAEGLDVDHRWIRHRGPTTPEAGSAEERHRAAAYDDLHRRASAERAAWTAWVDQHLAARQGVTGEAGSIRRVMESLGVTSSEQAGMLLGSAALGLTEVEAGRIARGLDRLRLLSPAASGTREHATDPERVGQGIRALALSGGGLLTLAGVARDVHSGTPPAEAVAGAAASTATTWAATTGGLVLAGPGAPLAATVTVVGGATLLGSAAGVRAQQLVARHPAVRHRRELDRRDGRRSGSPASDRE